MKAKALICNESQNFALEDVILDDCGPDQIAIRTHYSGVSIGTEFALIRNKLSWGPYPICTGYMGTGVVETVGSNVDDFKVGDKVYYRGNDGLALTDGTPVSPVSGTHCSRIIIKPGGRVDVSHIIPGGGMDVASMFVMPAVGLNGVDMANPRMGETVLVYGAGLIGLGVVAACAHRGCVVIAVDINAKQLSLAKEMGADYVIDGSTEDVAEKLKEIVPAGADVVFESTGIPQCVDPAISLCRRHGKFIWQGNYGKEPLSMDFLQIHKAQLTTYYPCNDGLEPCRRAVIKNMASGALPWEKCITHRISCKEAPEMFERINKGQDKDIIGVVISWLD